MSIRLKLLCFLGAVVLICPIVLPTAVKWAAYKAAGVSSVQSAIGHQVTLHRDGKSWEGTLTQADYRWNDKWGFFDLAIEIEGRGFISAGLEPAELSDLIVED